MNMIIKDKEKTSYVRILGFMTEMGLRRTSLLVYAVIYSFSLGKEGFFYGTRSYLSSVCGVTKRQISRILHNLCEEGHIFRYSDGERSGYKCSPHTRVGYRDEDE